MCKSPFPKFGYPEQLAVEFIPTLKMSLEMEAESPFVTNWYVLKDCLIWLSKKRIKCLPFPPSTVFVCCL